MVDTFEYKGHTFRIDERSDDCMGAPWEECDWHGPVSEWTTRNKLPGELVLISNRRGRRYYNFQEACRLARTEWGFSNRGDAAKAAMKDFERLRAWCDNRWSYVVLEVTLLDDDGSSSVVWRSLGGVESDQDISEYQHALADECLYEVRHGSFKQALSLDPVI